MWAHAVEQAKTTQSGCRAPGDWLPKGKAPSGFEIEMDAKTITCTNRCYRRSEGRWSVPRCVEDRGTHSCAGVEPVIPDSAKKVADWTYPWVCGNCTEAKFVEPMM